MNYTGLNFNHPHTHLNGDHPFQVSLLGVMRASVTVGYGGGYTPFNPLSMWPFHLFHLGLPVGFIRPLFSPSYLTHVFSWIPKSSRRYISERLGMAITKIWADQSLGVPWLAEVEFLEACGMIQFDPFSRERPDLVGQDSTTAWHVFESKGRPTDSLRQSILSKAKRQASRIQRINGVAPLLSIGSVLHDSPTGLHLTLDDPPPDHGEGYGVKVNETGFYEAYYGQLRNLIRNNEVAIRKHSEHSFHTIQISVGKFKYQLGLLSAIHEDVREGVSFLRAKPIKAFDTENVTIGGDGIVIFLD